MAVFALFAITAAGFLPVWPAFGGSARRQDSASERIPLPSPRSESGTSLEKALHNRRSIRTFKKEPLTLAELSQLLWAAQGENNSRGFRTAPSAGALYPLEVYAIAGNVTGLAPGLYHYVSSGHAIIRISEGDLRQELCEAALGQPSIRSAAVAIIIAAHVERTTGKYGERGVRYVHMEAGHAAQSLSLQAVSLGLGTVVIGAFSDDKIQSIMRLDASEKPFIIMPVGRK